MRGYTRRAIQQNKGYGYERAGNRDLARREERMEKGTTEDPRRDSATSMKSRQQALSLSGSRPARAVHKLMHVKIIIFSILVQASSNPPEKWYLSYSKVHLLSYTFSPSWPAPWAYLLIELLVKCENQFVNFELSQRSVENRTRPSLNRQSFIGLIYGIAT